MTKNGENKPRNKIIYMNKCIEVWKDTSKNEKKSKNGKTFVIMKKLLKKGKISYNEETKPRSNNYLRMKKYLTTWKDV